MDLLFFFKLDMPFFKDKWGYKTQSLEPGVCYGEIVTYFNSKKHSLTSSAFTPEDTLIRDLLNGESINDLIYVNTKGVATHKLLNMPGALTLNLLESNFAVDINLHHYTPNTNNYFWRLESSDSGDAQCTLRITRPIEDMQVSDGEFAHVPDTGIQHLRAVKLFLNHPEEFYLSQSCDFITTAPKTIGEFRKIYERERGRSHIFPTSKQIILDPLIYTENEFEPAAAFARALVSGLN